MSRAAGLPAIPPPPPDPCSRASVLRAGWRRCQFGESDAHLHHGVRNDTMIELTPMPDAIEKLLAKMRQAPAGVRFTDAVKVAEHYFGTARQKGSSHVVFKMPWVGDPRVNVQNDHGKAKAYQVRQLLDAIDRLECERREGRHAQH